MSTDSRKRWLHVVQMTSDPNMVAWCCWREMDSEDFQLYHLPKVVEYWWRLRLEELSIGEQIQRRSQCQIPQKWRDQNCDHLKYNKMIPSQIFFLSFLIAVKGHSAGQYPPLKERNLSKKNVALLTGEERKSILSHFSHWNFSSPPPSPIFCPRYGPDCYTYVNNYTYFVVNIFKQILKRPIYL